MPSFNSALMGAAFRPQEAKDIVKALAIGEALEARRDPENEFDPNAIALYSQDQHLGFIERGLAEELAPLMDKGAELTVEVIGFMSTIKPYLSVEVVEAEDAA